MRYREAKIDDCVDILKNAVKQAGSENKSIFVYGNTGVGKTHFCHAVANGKKQKVENFVSMLYEFRDYIQRGCFSEGVNRLCDNEYLIIDDIGSEKTSDFVIEFIYTIINRRYENLKKTILTTNLTLKDFGDRYGDRILSRLSEMCVLVELSGSDKRFEEKIIAPITSYKDN